MNRKINSIPVVRTKIEEQDRRTIMEKHTMGENGISKEEYDEWRYKYPELDTYQKHAKVPSQELSDYLVKELTKKEK